MKQYECITGQPVDHIPALVALPPGPHNSLCGLALRRPHGRYEDEWYPMWAAPRNLAWRDVITETIPAFFQAVAASAQLRAEVRYAVLARYVQLAARRDHIPNDDLVDSELLELEIAAGEQGLIFVRQEESNSYRLLPMTDCEFNVFIAASVQEVAQ